MLFEKLKKKECRSLIIIIIKIIIVIYRVVARAIQSAVTPVTKEPVGLTIDRTAKGQTVLH